MHILVIGAAGMVGRKLVAKLARDGGPGGRAIDTLTLVDVVPPAVPEGFSGSAEAVTADLSAPGEAEALVARRPDIVFHLAAVVSGEAEGTRYLFEAIRQEGLKAPYKPRVVFTSSIAVFGAPFPDRIHDEFFTTPLTSYGTQKAIGELLLSDYSRRGFFDGIGIRLPTICIRPGKPNLAASGFFSGILREPLAGRRTSATGSRARGPRWASSSMPRRSTRRRWATGATSACPACRPRSARRSRRSGASAATRPWR